MRKQRGSANRDSVAVDKHFGQFIGESARRRMTSIHPSATFLPQAQAFSREAIRPQILSLASETILCCPAILMTPLAPCQ